MPTITGERGRGKDLRRGSWFLHQQQTVAVAGFTAPQRGHDARCGGRCNAPPQELQNFESAGLSWSQYRHRVIDMSLEPIGLFFAGNPHCRAVQPRAIWEGAGQPGIGTPVSACYNHRLFRARSSVG